MILSTILYFVAFLFLCATFFVLNSISTAVGVKNGLLLFAKDFLPVYLAMTEKMRDDQKADTMMSVLEAEENGDITSEEATTILRRMRGEI